VRAAEGNASPGQSEAATTAREAGTQTSASEARTLTQNEETTNQKGTAGRDHSSGVHVSEIVDRARQDLPNELVTVLFVSRDDTARGV
jgi:hypothetical protein